MKVYVAIKKELSFIIESLRDESKAAKYVEQNEHKAIPPMGMSSIDGTKVM